MQYYPSQAVQETFVLPDTNTTNFSVQWPRGEISL